MEKPRIPDFNIKALCGSGAYGDVWLCSDRNGIARAVKTLDKERLKKMGVLQREEKAIQLFRTQVPKHKNLIEIFHIGETESIIYYVMELADNIGTDDEYNPDTLSNRLKSRIYSPEESISFISDLLDAVQVLHDAELAHRDIKPSNIIFVDNVPKLADIGLVTSTNTEISIVGTVNFMPPDSSTGNDADLYSMGKILYCVFTGKPVEDFPTLPDRYLSEKSPVIMRTNKVAIKACSKIPENRFKSISQFKSALKGDSGALKNKAIPFRRLLLPLLLVLAILLGLYFCYAKFSYMHLEENTPDASRDEKYIDIENELLLLNACVASGEWQRSIDVVILIKAKYPQSDHTYLNKIAEIGRGEIGKILAQAEIEKARIETEKNKLELEKSRFELDRGKHESEKAKFETAKTLADRGEKQAVADKSEIASLKSEIISLASRFAQIPDGFAMVKAPADDTAGWATEKILSDTNTKTKTINDDNRFETANSDLNFHERFDKEAKPFFTVEKNTTFMKVGGGFTYLSAYSLIPVLEGIMKVNGEYCNKAVQKILEAETVIASFTKISEASDGDIKILIDNISELKNKIYELDETIENLETRYASIKNSQINTQQSSINLNNARIKLSGLRRDLKRMDRELLKKKQEAEEQAKKTAALKAALDAFLANQKKLAGMQDK
ncbi:MAG: protein kinase [Victivallales bacterium]|jgi:serine/threonine protein kinase